MSTEDFEMAFPTLTEMAGGKTFLEKLDAMRPDFEAATRDALRQPKKKHSRGFWNTCGAWCFDDNTGTRASATFRLTVIEKGLSEAKRAGKEHKFRDDLLKNEAGFEDAIAELRLLGQLGPLAPHVDQELPGKTPGRNYDVHLTWNDGTELHLDAKRRGPENELGSLNQDRQLDVEELLGRDFDALAWLTLKKNFHSEADALSVAIVVDEARRVALEAPDELEPLNLDSVATSLGVVAREVVPTLGQA